MALTTINIDNYEEYLNLNKDFIELCKNMTVNEKVKFLQSQYSENIDKSYKDNKDNRDHRDNKGSKRHRHHSHNEKSVDHTKTIHSLQKKFKEKIS